MRWWLSSCWRLIILRKMDVAWLLGHPVWTCVVPCYAGVPCLEPVGFADASVVDFLPIAVFLVLAKGTIGDTVTELAVGKCTETFGPRCNLLGWTQGVSKLCVHDLPTVSVIFWQRKMKGVLPVFDKCSVGAFETLCWRDPEEQEFDEE